MSEIGCRKAHKNLQIHEAEKHENLKLHFYTDTVNDCFYYYSQMTDLVNDTNQAIAGIVDQMYKMVKPPEESDPAFLKLTVVDDRPQPLPPPSHPYDLLQLTEWARDNMIRGNCFRKVTHQLKSIGGGRSFDTYDGENYDIQLGMYYSELLPEVVHFFKDHPHWSYNVYGMSEALVVSFHLKIPLRKKQLSAYTY